MAEWSASPSTLPLSQPSKAAGRLCKCGVVAILGAALIAAVGPAQAEEKEPAAIVEIGAAGEWDLDGGPASFGPAVSVETTPIRDWLEIEAGVSSLFGRGPTDWSADFLFKKPFTLSTPSSS
jgi:hypothetical protein